MFSVLHGDNVIQSRDRLQAYRVRAKQKQIKDILQVDGRKLDLNQLTQLIETQSLFSTPKLIIIENLHKHPAKKTLKTLIQYLNANALPETSHVVLWETKSLTATQLKKLPPNSNIESFKTSPIVFTFLDSLTPKSAKTFLPLYHEACQKDSSEFVFFMLIRHVRQLFQTADPQSKLPPWQKRKLGQQAKHWPASSLIRLHDALTDIDWRQKNGRLIGTFQSELEKILLTM